MRIAIMQPYFFPYIGYFRLIQSVEAFTFLDDVNFIKQGWINRNRLLVNGQPAYFTVPVDKLTQGKKIREARIDIYRYDYFRKKLLKTLVLGKKTPQKFEVIDMVESVLEYNGSSISELAIRSIRMTMAYLNLEQNFLLTSKDMPDLQEGRLERVFDICHRLQATMMVNAIGGKELYNKSAFRKENIELKFIKAGHFDPRETNLSILDLLIRYDKDTVVQMINNYALE